MKIIRVTLIAGAVLLVLVVIQKAGLIASFVQGSAIHKKQIEKATEKMAAYRYDDWRGLYNDCTSLYRRVKPSNIGIETNEWPTRVVYLQPAYVWVNEECISMNWTGGFDDFSLYLYVYRQNGMLDGAPVTPGVYIVDTRGKLPAHPYDLMGSRTNQAPAATGSPAPN